MNMDDDPDDSFDAVLASLEIPTAAKVQKIDESAVKNTNNSSIAAAPVQVSKNSATTPAAATNAVSKGVPNPHCILVHPKQRGNPILKSILNVPIEFRDDIVPDYVVGRTSCVLFLSLKYHNLNPDYICQRLKTLGNLYELRVLLVQVDTPDPNNALKSLTRIALLADLTLMLAWNTEEAGKIIEVYKQFENRPPDLIMERAETSSHQKLVTALTSIKPINKTDGITLLQNFGNLENIVNASEDRLSQISGLGPRKAKKLYKTLQEPFLSK